MKKTIAILAGDGIGPEIIATAVKVLKKIESEFKHKFVFEEGLIGGAAYDVFGEHLPKETLDLCSSADAVLFGAVGGPVNAQNIPKWKNVERDALLKLRNYFNLFANLRPIYLPMSLNDLSVLKKDVFSSTLDIMIVRELISDVYFGKHRREITSKGIVATDEMIYMDYEIARISKLAFEIAKTRKGKITLVDKANVLETSRLWREVVSQEHFKYASVELEYMYVDNAAMQLVKNPFQFDVILTSNLFGDILSDLGASIVSSIGMLPSASLNADKFAVYEPISGSAQAIAGKNIANPIGQILSAAMMLKYSFEMENEAQSIERAVYETLIQDKIRTSDIMEKGCTSVGTKEMGDRIRGNIRV